MEEATAEGGMGYLSKPYLRPGVKLEGASAHLETQPGTPQLRILTCQSTSPGVALAAGLPMYCQYCHKRTEGSFGEPATDAATRNDEGEAACQEDR